MPDRSVAVAPGQLRSRRTSPSARYAPWIDASSRRRSKHPAGPAAGDWPPPNCSATTTRRRQSSAAVRTRGARRNGGQLADAVHQPMGHQAIRGDYAKGYGRPQLVRFDGNDAGQEHHLQVDITIHRHALLTQLSTQGVQEGVVRILQRDQAVQLLDARRHAIEIRFWVICDLRRSSEYFITYFSTWHGVNIDWLMVGTETGKRLGLYLRLEIRLQLPSASLALVLVLPLRVLPLHIQKRPAVQQILVDARLVVIPHRRTERMGQVARARNTGRQGVERRSTRIRMARAVVRRAHPSRREAGHPKNRLAGIGILHYNGNLARWRCVDGCRRNWVSWRELADWD